MAQGVSSHQAGTWRHNAARSPKPPGRCSPPCWVRSATGRSSVSTIPRPARWLLLLAGEFAAPEVKARLWNAADVQADPDWNTQRGEFTLGFGLDEPHPRGQLNARAMAGWVCRPGAWSAIFNEPNLDKFDEPTASDVDFPRIALSEARWDGTALHLAAHPQNDAVRDTTTEVTVTGLPSDGAWRVGDQPVDVIDGSTVVALVADDKPVQLRPINPSGG